MKTNELKKGTEILLKDGSRGTMEDNKKGNIMMMNLDTIYGGRTMGEQYTWKIVGYTDEHGNLKGDVELTPAQLKCRDAVNAFDSMF